MVPGDNVIAVVVIQSGATSSDIEMALELTAEVDTVINVPSAPRLKITRNPATGEMTISWTNGGTLQQATTLQNGGATAWTDVSGNPVTPYTFTPPATGNLFYRVR